MNRRLAAILVADVVGYSRMMGYDEAGTHALLGQLRSEIVAPLLAAHGGRLVNTAGDGFLVEFHSTVSAIACALDLQGAVSGRSLGVGAPLRLRIGINSGEVLSDGADINGEAVNIAARLESLGAPGEIIVSAKIQQEADGRIAATFQDLGERRLHNIEHPVRVYRVQRAAASQPVWRTPIADGPHRTNVPTNRSPLYGRDDDIAAVRALVARYGLVSIVGAAGIGKTRLAQAIAQTQRETFADGVWMVELGSLSDPGLVAAEIARALGLPLVEQRPGADAIASWLASQSLLLILDNCERLLEPVAAIVEATTRKAGNVRVLITSQEPLKISDEHVYRLNTLAVPTSATMEGAEGHGAVQLFVGRAQAADAHFVLTHDNVPTVIDICRRLDGIPLALELAAARIPLLGVEGISSRLGERFQILTGGSRFVPRRHQTLHAALDFSHDLLTKEEQAVFRRLGVFVGSFASASAEHVCGDAAIDRWQVFDCLGTLIDKSIVIAEGGKVPRLRLLETTRAYALEKLEGASETEGVQERHARATAQRMSQMYADYCALPEDDFLSSYEFEVDNLRAALTWAQREDSELAIVLIGDSLKLWQMLAMQPEAKRYCEAAVPLICENTPPRAAGRFWYALAMILADTWPVRSREAAARAVSLLREANDPGVLAHALTRLASSSGEPSQQQWCAVEELQRLQDPAWPAMLRMLVLYASAKLNRGANRLAEARDDYEKLGKLAQSCAASGMEMGARENVAEITLMMGDVDQALAISREMVARYASYRDRLFYMFALGGLTTASLFNGDSTTARDALTKATPLILHYDLGYRYAYTSALLAALENRLEPAVRMIGYGDNAHATHGRNAPDQNEATARARVTQRLTSMDPTTVERWLHEGALMTDADAYRQILATG